MNTHPTPITDITDDTEGQVMPVLLTVTQAATLTGMSLRSTYRAIEADAIPHIRIGRRISTSTAKLLTSSAYPSTTSPGPSTEPEDHLPTRTYERAVSRSPRASGSVLYRAIYAVVVTAVLGAWRRVPPRPPAGTVWRAPDTA